MSATRYTEYDRFAWMYRRDWGIDYHREARSFFEKSIFPTLPKGGRVLDLCCGVGDLSVLIAESGFAVTGLDGSEEMLRYARERLPEAEFVAGDARAFELPTVFDAAISTFDSLNHILELPQLEACFANVWRALKPGGLFVFDMNMEESFQLLWHGCSSIIEEEVVCLTRGSYDSETRTGRADVTLFRSEEGSVWRRSDISVAERCYTQGEIVAGLQKAGFDELACREGYDVGMRGDIALGRMFFLATK